MRRHAMRGVIQYPTREILLASYDGDVDLVNSGELVRAETWHGHGLARTH